MTRETITFIVFFALLAAVFKFGGSDWRNYQGQYRHGAYEQSRRNWDRQASRTSGMISPDSLAGRLERLDVAGRLERLADSLNVLRSELDGYEGLLLAARDALAGGQIDGDDGSGKYFSAVRAYRRLDGMISALEGEADTMRLEMEAARALADENPGGGGARINWLTPTEVPVREACITCHLPLDSKGQVMLYPDNGSESDYPDVMVAHDYRRFGCTVCHAGAAPALDFRAAHGPDHMLRQFRPGKLALRACGICHAEMSPLGNESVEFAWPEACAECHEADSLPSLAALSGEPALKAPPDENMLRSWMLRHWTGKSGTVPDRAEFEPALAMLISGEVRRIAVEPILAEQLDSAPAKADSLPDGTVARCPKCGQTFRIGLGGRQAVCPLDGTPLVPAGGEK